MSDQGGDPACWASQVCDLCGQVVEDERTHDCSGGEADDVPEGAATR